MHLFSAASEPEDVLAQPVQRKVFQCVVVNLWGFVPVQMLPFTAPSEPVEMLA